MKLRLLLCAFTLTVVATLHAQPVVPVTPAEIVADVTAKAQTQLSSDAELAQIFFFRFQYQNMTLSVDMQTGKANGWLFRYYSPSLDSTVMLLGFKPQAGPVQTISLNFDTVAVNVPFAVASSTIDSTWVDSPAAIAGSLSGGADAFLQQHSGSFLALMVLINNPIENKYVPHGEYWVFRYNADADTLTCVVEAASGTPVRCVSENTPKIFSLPRLTARVSELYTYDVEATGKPAPTFSLLQGPQGMSIDPATGMISWTPGAAQTGVHTVQLRASNTLGIDEQTYDITVTEAEGPTITSVPTTDAFAGTLYRYQLVATATPNPKYYLTTFPTGMKIDSTRGLISWTPDRSQKGPHDVTVEARNIGGTDSQSYQVFVNTKAEFPSPPTNQKAIVGQAYSIGITVDAFPAPTFHLLTAPSGLTIDQDAGLIEWTPAANQVGDHQVVLEARNKAGAGQLSFAITVEQANAAGDAPVPPSFRLAALYPNPFSSESGREVSLVVELSKTSDLRVVLYDQLGREALRLPLEFLSKGEHRLALSATGLASGVYRVLVTDGVSTASTLLMVL